MMTTWPQHLVSRFDNEGSRKLLSLDGGGIRGVLSLEILAEIEHQLAEARGVGPEFRLCDYFDYIAGTSTGAIVAAGLAIGMAVKELQEFYEKFGSQIFDQTLLIQRLKSFYRSEPLAEKLKEIFHDGHGRPADLTTERLRCLLLVVTRNFTTDSPWPISTNPFAKYNDLSRPDCNLRIPLWKLVRASTAAPVYFPPEIVEWDPSNPKKTFVFEDGGITPYNNPAFLLFKMATQPAYQLEWNIGEKNLLLVSIGTGAAPAESTALSKNLLTNATGLPGALMYGSQIDQDINCRTFGRCVHGSQIDRELGDLVLQDDQTPPKHRERFFRYVRYNADLSQTGLNTIGAGDIRPEAVQRLDAIDQMDNLRRIGRAVAREVRIGHFGSFIAV